MRLYVTRTVNIHIQPLYNAIQYTIISRDIPLFVTTVYTHLTVI